MKYFVCAFLPIFLQSLILFLIIVMNQGNGSWVGLGAFLLGMFVIPSTLIANIFYLKFGAYKTKTESIVKCFVTAILAPFVIIVFLFFL